MSSVSLSFHLLAPLGFASLHVFTYSDGSSDLSPWKHSRSQGRAKPAAQWSFSFKNSFYSPVNPFPLISEEAAAPKDADEREMVILHIGMLSRSCF